MADLLAYRFSALAFLVAGLLRERKVFSPLFGATRGRVGALDADSGLHGLIPCPCAPFRQGTALRALYRVPAKRRCLRLRPHVFATDTIAMLLVGNIPGYLALELARIIASETMCPDGNVRGFWRGRGVGPEKIKPRKQVLLRRRGARLGAGRVRLVNEFLNERLPV